MNEIGCVQVFLVVLFRPEGFLVDEWIETGKIGYGSSIEFTIEKEGCTVVIRAVRTETFSREFLYHFDARCVDAIFSAKRIEAVCSTDEHFLVVDASQYSNIIMAIVL